MDKLDLTQPLEAVHRETGAVELVSHNGMPTDRCFYLSQDLEGGWYCFQRNGAHLCDACPWSIRNADLTANPSTPSNEELTQRMEIAPRTLARLVKLAREMADPEYTVANRDRWEAEARSIVSDLPKPVDPIDSDLALAKKLKQEAFDADRGSMPEDWITIAVRNGIRTGRTLAAEGTAHE